MAKTKKTNKPKQKSKVLHPNSRKAIKLPGVALRLDRLDCRKSSKVRRQQTLADKLKWFRDNLDDKDVYTKSDVLKLIDRYTHRFDPELEQMSIIHGIKGRKNKQHFNREFELKDQIEKDERDFSTCGIEIPDLFNKKNVAYLKQWKDELNLLPNFKLRKIIRSDLSEK